MSYYFLPRHDACIKKVAKYCHTEWKKWGRKCRQAIHKYLLAIFSGPMVGAERRWINRNLFPILQVCVGDVGKALLALKGCGVGYENVLDGEWETAHCLGAMK